MLFNTDINLWKNYASFCGKTTIKDGYVITEKDGVVARFSDNAHAEKVLKEAGIIYIFS